ncbi:CPBP family intramembrane glutamic endopeptidase [Spirosoma pollinicola]|nr:CPBP family intramembrane glutamic endopeptidase [Spirosoma pollinicola]
MTLKGDFKNFFVPLAIYWLLPVILIETTAYFSTSTLPRVAVITILVYGLFEEIGWRGFLQQALVSLPKFVRITLITVLWFAWHLNFEMSLSNLTFFLILFAGSWALGFIAEKTNCLLAVSAIHSLNNFFSDSNVYKIGVLSFLLLVWVLSIVYRNKLGGNKINSYLPVTLV